MEYEISNPYAVSAATSVGLNQKSNHASGNALAANAEARAVAEIKAQVVMARQFPRDPALAAERILGECQRASLAENAVYVFPRGGTNVTGPSIRLAEVMARNWGNNTFGYEVIERNKDANGIGYSVLRAYAWDLETNMYISRQFEVKHYRSTKSGGYKIEDDRDIYELEANTAARRMRACILQMIPGDVTEAAVNACRMTSSNAIAVAMKDPKKREDAVTKMVNLFAKIGATEDDLQVYLNAKRDAWNADHMLKLRDAYTSLKDNVVQIGDLFPRLASNDTSDLITAEQVKALREAIAATGKQSEIGTALKKMGFAKVADVPAVKYNDVCKLVDSYKNV